MYFSVEHIIWYV